jgi:hypothetical protein
MVDVRRLEDLRLFASQDWAAAERGKDLYWRDWKRKNGPAASIRIADELRRQALAQKPDWPSEEERREDHETHLRVLAAIDLVSARRKSAAR